MEPTEFKNEPPLDFAIPKTRKVFADGILAIQTALSKGAFQVKPIFLGKEQAGEDSYRHLCPSHSSLTVAEIQLAGEKLTKLIIKDQQATLQDGWSKLPPNSRSKIIKQAADILRQERLRLAAIIVYEAGKSWREADADVVEAIDFCEYYAAWIDQYGHPRKLFNLPGEQNTQIYFGRGNAVVISPWNFPLAIACGMTVAALIAGNRVVFKPAAQGSLIGYEFSKILLEAGVPPSAITFLPGRGDTVGDMLVRSPNTNIILFTGSKEVGLSMIEKASQTLDHQFHVKKVIAEMGGKNAIIVDEDADQDEAIKAILQSAFSYAGQKCSACSRLIIVGDIYASFCERLSQAADSLICGPAEDPGNFFGPVIDQKAQARIAKIIEKNEKIFSVAHKGKPPSGGSFVPSLIFTDVTEESELWNEEIFGPVLAVRQAPDFESAVKIANRSQYALTGGVFSRSISNIELAKQTFEVGNLYINRGCTGAIVGRQPFGGFKLSGVGSKAGGGDYLLQLIETKVICENTTRRGFSPELV
ncbi:MAG TPA: aldehyde dehydrogenase family protein [Oligoflexia bacterium]|mgnify:CR=1 FL=1|nr:aldehyde dehydrogenase family protein [Oligoflexia bacterium]HMP27158.1 aldehyde dehydrogenase family protein [Oligoflexia bacterium]